MTIQTDGLVFNKYISILYRKTQIHLNHTLKAYDLNSAEFVYLLHLDETRVNLRDLGDDLRMDHAQTTRVVKSLEEKGLILKERGEDRRCYLVSLTDQGQIIKPQILSVMREWVGQLTQDLEENELELFLNLLHKVAHRAIEETNGR